MLGTNFSKEAVNIFTYIKNELIRKYPTNKITIEYFLLSILENEECIAYQMLSKTTLTSTLVSMQSWFSQSLTKTMTGQTSDRVEYDILINKCIDESKKNFNTKEITSGHIVLSLLKLNEPLARQFSQIGITYEQLLANLNNVLPEYEKRISAIAQAKVAPQTPKGIVEDLLIDMNKLAFEGKIDEVIGNDDIIKQIFSAWSKRDCNNVVLVGESGVGKTATVSHIANLIISGDVPNQFKNNRLMRMDFSSLVTGAALRGNFEAKFNALIEDSKKRGGYIFFVDDMQSILSDKSRFGEVDTETMLDTIFMERSIKFICTMNNKAYSTFIAGNPSMKRRFQKVEILEKDEEEVLKIMHICKEKYEKYHNVRYTDEAIEESIKLSKRYAKDSKLPDYPISLIDEAGANKSLYADEDERISKYKEQLSEIESKLNEINNNGEGKSYDDYDRLKNEEVKIKSEISQIEKDELLNKIPITVDAEDIRKLISFKTSVPITTLTNNERDRLKQLNEKLKSFVIGQNEAVDEVCRAVKRQRIGIANSNRPVVLFFSGMSGVGKTFLAKKLSQEVFGDEKSMVRLDMSEYSDKMSVSKLYGAAAGYIGYDKGGILTEAIKKNSHCVLLLDEMEKANEEVHNVFLQLFDEGRLTDNMGNIVDFSNVIVIMTSNVGAREISSKGKGMGFVKNTDADNRESIEKAMKTKFAPEFINRIDCIVYFNKLSEDNVKEIIKLEIKNLNDRLEKIGFKLGNSFNEDNVISFIYNKVKEESEYGARPVIHTIQHEIEDKITDYIIENQPDKGFTFETETIGFNKN